MRSGGSGLVGAGADMTSPIAVSACGLKTPRKSMSDQPLIESRTSCAFPAAAEFSTMRGSSSSDMVNCQENEPGFTAANANFSIGLKNHLPQFPAFTPLPLVLLLRRIGLEYFRYARFAARTIAFALMHPVKVINWLHLQALSATAHTSRKGNLKSPSSRFGFIASALLCGTKPQARETGEFGTTEIDLNYKSSAASTPNCPIRSDRSCFRPDSSSTALTPMPFNIATSAILTKAILQPPVWIKVLPGNERVALRTPLCSFWTYRSLLSHVNILRHRYYMSRSILSYQLPLIEESL